MKTILYSRKEDGKIRPLTFKRLMKTVNSEAVTVMVGKARNVALTSDAREKAYRSLPRVWWGVEAFVNGKNATQSGVIVYKMKLPRGVNLSDYYETIIRPSKEEHNIIFAYPNVSGDTIYIGTLGNMTTTKEGVKYPIIICFGDEGAWALPLEQSIIIPPLKEWLFMDIRKIFNLVKNKKNILTCYKKLT